MSDEQFVLRWHYHEVTLLRNLPDLLESEMLTDITLSVGCHMVKAHRLVLATCSTYFLELFQKMEPLQHPVVVLHNTSLEDIKAVLSFVYRGHCLVSKEQLPSLLSVAKLLKIQGLCDMKLPYKKPPISTDELPTMIRIDEEVLPASDNRKDPHPSSIVRDYSISSKDRPTTITQSQTNVTTKEHEPPLESDNNYSQTATSSWGGTAPTTEPSTPLETTYDRMLQRTKTPHHHHHHPKDNTSETCKCFLCGKYLSNQYNLRVHMETHEEAYHACQSCPHVSRSRDALRKHISYRHPDEYHTRKRKKTEDGASVS